MNLTEQEALSEFDGCFLTRPRPVQDELLEAYLHRVLHANGHESLSGLIGGEADPTDTKRGFLKRRLCLSSDELDGLAEPGYAISQVKGDRKLFLTPRIRWCPQCVGERPILFGRWLYRTTVVCTHHRVFMRDECPRCHAPQKISLFTGLCNECGASLSAVINDDVPEPLVRLQGALDDALSNGQPNPFLFNLRYHEAAKLVHYLGIIACGARQGPLRESANSRTVHNDCMLMKEVSDLLKQWPDRFITLFRLKQAMPATNSVRNDFGSLYWILYRSLKGNEFQFLRDLFENYVNSHWAGILTKRNRSFSEKTRRSHPRKTLKKAAKELETTPALLKHMSAKLQGSEIVYKSGRRVRTIGTNQAKRIKGVTLTEAAKILHLPERRIRMLIAAELLKPEISPVIYSSASWFISYEQLQALFVRPSVLAPEVGVLVNKECRYGRLSESEFIELARVLTTQGLDVVNQSEGPVPLGLAEVRKADLRRWLLTLRARKSSSMSVDEAAKVLGVKQQVGYQLVNSGLLRSYRNPHHAELRIRDVDLKAFQQQYVSLAELARGEKTSPKALLGKILCSPVTGPSVDCGRQYFYRISDLAFSGLNIDYLF